MKKRFLGIVSILYALIILYVWINGSLSNYLAPNMQIYLKISFIPLLVMGISSLIKAPEHYHFKISDLVLLVPIIFLIISGDGRLSTTLATNRMSSFTSESKQDVKSSEPKKETIEKKEEIIYNFDNVDVNVVDENYSVLADYITFITKAKDFMGKTIKLRGFAIIEGDYIPKGYFAIGKYMISCCAADAEFTGFIAKSNENIKNNAWYEIEGVIEEYTGSDEYIVMTIDVKNIKEINEKAEEQYVYPCFNYSDGKCSEVAKYNLDY